MRTLTLVMAYYLNAGMLRVQYDHLKAFPSEIKERFSVIVIDDGSPQNPAWGEDIGVPLEVYRMGLDIPWNQDACRNLGARLSITPWLLLTDMDHKIHVDTMAHLVRGKFDRKSVYRFSRVSEPKLEPYKHHPNSWFLTRELYFASGGYDERLAGSYGTDGDFATRLRRVAGDPIQLEQVIIRVPREVVPDASTTTLKRKDDPRREEIQRNVKHQRDSGAPDPVLFRFPYSKIY